MKAFHTFSFVLFIALKVASPLVADWSWWWLLMPEVPTIVVILKHFGQL